MRENDGRKLDHQTLETIRFRAIQAVEAGQYPEDVAAAYGLHRKTVYGWIAKYRDGGPQALKARAVPGRPSTLSAEQLRRLYALITGVDPRQLQFEFAVAEAGIIGVDVHGCVDQARIVPVPLGHRALRHL